MGVTYDQEVAGIVGDMEDLLKEMEQGTQLQRASAALALATMIPEVRSDIESLAFFLQDISISQLSIEWPDDEDSNHRANPRVVRRAVAIIVSWRCLIERQYYDNCSHNTVDTLRHRAMDLFDNMSGMNWITANSFRDAMESVLAAMGPQIVRGLVEKEHICHSWLSQLPTVKAALKIK